jgi:hypothetical protein
MLTRRSFLSITTAATAVAALGRVPQRHPLAIIALGPLGGRVQRRLQARGYVARYWVWDFAPPDAADLGAAVPVVIPRRKWGERRGISDALAATLGDGRCTRVLLVAGLGDEVAARLAGPVARVLDERRTVVAVAALTPAREVGPAPCRERGDFTSLHSHQVAAAVGLRGHGIHVAGEVGVPPPARQGQQDGRRGRESEHRAVRQR